MASKPCKKSQKALEINFQQMIWLASACLVAAIGESVEVEGGQGGRGWEYLLGMPLWSEPLERNV